MRYSVQRSHNTKTTGNITFLPVNKTLFNQSFIHCSGIITGGGFETPAEALHLGKKIITIPIRSQYEQQCNAAALKQLGILKLKTIDADFKNHLHNWMNTDRVLKMDYSQTIPQCLEYLFAKSVKELREEREKEEKELLDSKIIIEPSIR